MNSLCSHSWLCVLRAIFGQSYSVRGLTPTHPSPLCLPHPSSLFPFVRLSPVLASCSQGQRPWLSAEAFSCCKSPVMIALVCVCVGGGGTCRSFSIVYYAWACRCAHVCARGRVMSAVAGRQAAVKLSLSWPTFPPAFPQLAPSECTRSNASHSSRFRVITAFPCNRSFALLVFSFCCVLTPRRLIEFPHIEVKRI